MVFVAITVAAPTAVRGTAFFITRVVVARIEIHTCYPFAMDAKQLLAEALRLSDEERAALAGELIQSLDREVDADAEAAWSEEIRTRLDRLEAGTAKTIPWSEVRRRIHAAAGRGPRA
jgi:putative addiction module component (TIGR02574 family)